MWNNINSLLLGRKNPFLLLLAALFVVSCSDENDFVIEEPTAQGVFVDERDSTEYRYVHIGGLDWTIDNLAYDLGDLDLSRVYQSVDDDAKQVYTTTKRAKYGMLYSYSGAVQAVPEGWRLPTDEDWATLEASHGYLSESFNLLYGGYYTKNKYAAADNGNRFMGSWAYFWTVSGDSGKDGQYYFIRKKFYDRDYMERLSINPEAYYLSVRLVR